MSLIQLYLASQILAAIFWFSFGYKLATYARHKRNILMRHTIEATCRDAAESGRNEPPAGDILALMDLIQKAPDHVVLRASRTVIRFEWAPDDPTERGP